ncbi:MAG: PAS domain S-box protein [Verrucomicrobiota bacterium]
MKMSAAHTGSPGANSPGVQILRKAWEFFPSAIVVTDPCGVIKYVNPAFEKVTGYSVGEALGKNPRILKSGNQKPEVYEDLWRTISSGGTWSGRLQNRRKDGSLYWESATIAPLCDGKGKILHYIAVKENVTAEEEMQQANERRYAQTLEAVDDAVWDWNLTTGTAFFSPKYYSMLGYDVGEFPATYESWRSLVHPEDLARTEGELLRNIESGKGYGADIRMKSKSGEWIWISARGNIVEHDAQGKALRMLGTHTDISGRKRAEEALLKSSEEFQTMFEMASIGMAQCDPQTGQWLRVNPKMCRITGYTAAEMLGMKVADITHPADREKDAEEFRRVVRGELPSYRLEKRYVRKDGETVWVNVNMTVLRDSGGKPVRTMAAIEDITDRKRAEDSLRAETIRRQELEQEVLAIAESEQRRIGHDLHDGICQELSGIQFVTELIAKRLPEDLPEKDLLAKTSDDVRKVILHTRHLSHSLAPVALEKGDLSTALAELAATTERTFGIGCAFACLEAPEISSSTTATHLYRIAQESIQNAIRHGKATSIKITLVPSGSDWVLRVADNGAPARQKKRPGRGLNIMRYRASMFGGSLQFHQNAGTTMTCTFSL